MSKKDLIDAVPLREAILTKEKRRSVAVDAVLDAYSCAAMKDWPRSNAHSGFWKHSRSPTARLSRGGRNPAKPGMTIQISGVARAEVHPCEGPEGRA